MTNEQHKSWRFPEWLAAAVMLGFRVGMQRAEMLTGSAAAWIKLNNNLSEMIVVAAVNEAIVDGEVPALEALAVSVDLGEDGVPVQI
uniref:Uncharacterized protein n=1 Tax=Oryza barthii TaxID=65489 RepID=A0A0D3HNK1_9ORYZ